MATDYSSLPPDLPVPEDAGEVERRLDRYAALATSD